MPPLGMDASIDDSPMCVRITLDALVCGLQVATAQAAAMVSGLVPNGLGPGPNRHLLQMRGAKPHPEGQQCCHVHFAAYATPPGCCVVRWRALLDQRL
jgi:hypothetical protein